MCVCYYNPSIDRITKVADVFVYRLIPCRLPLYVL